MRLLFPILRWFGLRKVIHTGRVIGSPFVQFQQTYYVWVWGKKWKKLNQLCRPAVINGVVKAVSRTKIEVK